MSSGGAALQPTFNGHVSTTQDALILFEACLQGHLSHVPRRPHDRERSTLIRSGSVFIYEENASGIKRWTDGVTWSPSRILGNFLVYRELDKPFPPGEKKRAMKKPNRRPSRPGEPYPSPTQRTDYTASSPNSSFGTERQPTDAERQLIGSLIDSYGFKINGLVKKTMSVTVQGVTHHLVSYYNVEDVMAGNLRAPSQTDTLQFIRPRPELTSKQSFRSPLEETEDVSELSGQNGYAYRMAPGGYDYGKQSQMYYPQQTYPPMAGPQPPMPQYTSSIPSMTPSYLQTGMTHGSMGQERPQYAQYDHNAYGRSIPPTPASSIPTSVPDRAPQSMYPPTSMGRPISALSPVNMDARNSMAYRPNHYGSILSITAPSDVHRHGQQSPVSLKYEERRDAQQGVPPSFAAGAAPYYSNTQMTGTWNGPAQH
ncbi:Global transcription regulator sge1 [Lithohypha guttulata]|uniref:Global transcription regulator sge1 n=1 Tax=Lithohypha guttulata TaxID=1690604 RepID=UPI002DDF6E82|nr:Global transcription regulator sge1 [Lithohypha guttulata]